MDIVAESLSAKILKSREVLVNGKDIMDYIRSKLSTAVEFSGVYDDIDNIPLSAQFNGSIVIVDSKEYIYSDKSEPNWQEIGDETVIGQLATDLAAVSSEVSAIFDDVSYIKSISVNYKTYADTINQLSSDGYALTTDIPTYSDISSNIHLSDYALTNNVSTAMELQQQFAGAKAYIDSVKGQVDSVKSYADGISSKVDNLSNDLIYATVFTDTSLEGLTASTGDAGIRKLVFKPSYFGMNSSDELKSIVLQTRSNSSGYGITSAYIRVRKYNGLGNGGEIIGTSKCFNWPAQNSKNIQIDFDQVIQFNSPIEQYYFECLSADASSNLGIVKVLGMAMRVLNSADPKLPQISGNYFVTGIYNGNETIFSQLRPPLSVSYRHAYSMADLSAQVDEKYDQLVGQSTDLSSADTIHGAKAYAKNYTDNAINNIQVPTDLSAFTNSPGYLSAVPSSYKTYEQTKNDLSNNNYVVIGKDNDVSSVNTLYGAKAYAEDYVAEYVDQHSSKNQIHPVSAWEKTELSNYILGNGEIAIATTDDNFKMKVGDGSKLFYQLPYFSNSINISYDAYSQLVIDEKVDPDILYVVSSDYINAYGQQMKNLSAGTDLSDAVTYGQLSSLSSELSNYQSKGNYLSSNALDGYSTYASIKSDLSVDGYAIVGSNIDLSTANTIYGVKAYINSMLGNLENIINNI